MNPGVWLNTAAAGMNLCFYFGGSGNWPHLVVALLCMGVAAVCFEL